MKQYIVLQSYQLESWKINMPDDIVEYDDEMPYLDLLLSMNFILLKADEGASAQAITTKRRRNGGTTEQESIN